MAKTVKITDENFAQEVEKADKLVVVDYWAAWCGPCKLSEPVIEELAEEYEGKVKIGKLNVDESHKRTHDAGVMSIPTMIAYKDGKEVDRMIGFSGKKAYEDLIKKAIG